MIERIIGLVACLLCAIPFYIIATYDKNSFIPITFWSGDKSLMGKVRNIAAYNQEMANLYKMYARAFVLAGVGCLLHLLFGIALILLEVTAGLYMVYKKYKEILSRYS